ncbi:MAG TPA: RDD family protein [Candidatus Krumholzibacteria bacterium]|nr:RDD family protein [Candidatus Krumholzibacteria bacterium]
MAAQSNPQDAQLEYAGFWRRFVANFIDGALLAIIIWPILIAVYGIEYFTSTDVVAGPIDFLLTWVLPTIAVVLFWMHKQATPGKMAVSARIVDATSGKKASTGQLIGRYFAYIPSTLGLCLGFLWIAFDPKKQGWHDKLAGTVVVRPAKRGPAPVRFATPS